MAEDEPRRFRVWVQLDVTAETRGDDRHALAEVLSAYDWLDVVQVAR